MAPPKTSSWNWKRKASRLGQWVPHNLIASQLLQRDALCRSFESKFATETFLARIVISDEKLVIYNNISTHRKRRITLQTKRLYSMFGEVWWFTVDHKIINQIEIVNTEKITGSIAQKMQKYRPSLVSRKRVLLLHLNTKQGDILSESSRKIL